MTALGLVVRALRKKQGLSQIQLAEAADLGQPSVSRVERGSDVNLSTVSKIAKGLGTVDAVLLHRAAMLEPFVIARKKAQKQLDAAIERVTL